MKQQCFTARGGQTGTNGRVSSRQTTSRTRFRSEGSTRDGWHFSSQLSSQRWLGTQANETTVFHSKKGVKQAQTVGYHLVKLVSRREQHDSGPRGAIWPPENACIAHNWVLSVSIWCLRTQKMEQQCTRAKWGGKTGHKRVENHRFGAKRPFHDPKGVLGTGREFQPHHLRCPHVAGARDR